MQDAELSRRDKEQLLASVPLFSRLDRKCLARLADACVPQSYRAGEVLLEEGTRGLGLLLITSGRVEVTKRHGDRRGVLATLTTGHVLGEMALVSDQPRSATATALEPTECLLITRDSFNTLMRKYPEIAWCVVPTLAERLKDAQDRILLAESSLGGQRGAAAPQPGAALDALDPEVPAAVSAAVPVDVEPRGELFEEDVRYEAWEDEEVDDGGPLLQVLRTQYGILMGGVEGLVGCVGLVRTFWSSLAEESGLSNSDSAVEVMKNLPQGWISAISSTVDEGGKLPERVARTYRRASRPR